jgi:uncharacterized phiE125 gp8 family phage protein
MTPWDLGIRWHLEQAWDEGPEWSADPLSEDFVSQEHLRSAHPEAEGVYVAQLIRTSLQEAERITGRSILPQTWSLVLSAFPAGGIVIPRPPLLSVASITYLDPDGLPVVMASSPAEFRVVAPSGPQAAKGCVLPLEGESWPSTQVGPMAVTVRYTAGYPLGADGIAQVPYDITQGRLVSIAEMYKQRSESVHISQSVAMRTARSLYRAYTIQEY